MSDQKHNKVEEKKEEVHLSGLKGGQRVKLIEGEAVETAAEVKEEAKKVKVARVRGKKYVEAKAKFDHNKSYALPEAIKLAKETSYASFGGSLELHLVVKKIGTNVNVNLPFSAGKEKKIEVISDETIEKLKAGKIDFDVLIATAEWMPKLVPFARVLGPKGMMPNPKNGTLVSDLSKAKSFSAAAITIKTEKEAPLIHLGFGKVSQDDKELIANAEAILKALGGARVIVRAFTKASMGPSVKISL